MRLALEIQKISNHKMVCEKPHWWFGKLFVYKLSEL